MTIFSHETATILEAYFDIAVGQAVADHDRPLGHQVRKLLKLRVISGAATRDLKGSDQISL
jgi:hypothetical protein